jgi:glycosyltransferase involved in cell wall biosynthesis
MKIAIILPKREDFSPESAGAISLVVRRFCEAWPDTVVMGTKRETTFPGIAYAPVNRAASIIAAILRARPEVIEVHQQPRLAVLLATIFPTKRVLLFLHNDPLDMRGLKHAWSRRWVAHRLHRVVCVSSYLAQRFGPGAVVLPNPLTLTALPPRSAPRSQLILYAGRLTAGKGADVFVTACAQVLPTLPGWQAVMIGGDRFGPTSPETPFVTSTRAAAAAAGVVFLGPQPHHEVLAAMARAAIVVVPSRWAEPFGLTALEAMASGGALITTGQGGLPEVAGDAALYVPAGDAAALATAIRHLGKNTATREALATAGLARAAAFDTSVVAARLEGLRRSGGGAI